MIQTSGYEQASVFGLGQGIVVVMVANAAAAPQAGEGHGPAAPAVADDDDATIRRRRIRGHVELENSGRGRLWRSPSLSVPGAIAYCCWAASLRNNLKVVETGWRNQRRGRQRRRE